MAVNNGLLGVAGGLVAALGSNKILLNTIYGSECIKAVERESQQLINQYCPPGFNSFSLITIISIAIGVMVFTLFWKEILQEAWNKSTSSD